jgi:Family of unknown function (DUF6807)
MARPDTLPTVIAVAAVTSIAVGCSSLPRSTSSGSQSAAPVRTLAIEQDERAGTISIFRAGSRTPIVTQNAGPDFRPYLHPIAAPDGGGVLTEDSPGHHKHQTGLYWGFTRVNGRDYFHNPGGDYWRRVSASVLPPDGDDVRWQTVYELLDESGAGILTETQQWSMRERNGTRPRKSRCNDRQIRLRRPVPADALARRRRGRGRQRGAAAQRTRRRPACHVDRRGHAGRRA